MTITMAAEAGQLELNAFEPITFYCLFQSIDTLAYAVETFVDNCVSGITANKERCKQLVENSGLPNMKVIEFAFDARDTGNASDYLPHNYPRNCVVYTGTHDNETLRGWFRDISPEERRLVRQYLRNFHDSDEGICEDLITLVMRSVANLCIIPMQDYLGLDNSARINQPSTLGKNWRWRLKKGQFTKKLQKEMLDLATRYGRRNWTKTEEELEAEKLEAEKNKK